MNKNFEKSQKQKRLLNLPNNLNPILGKIDYIKKKFRFGCNNLSSLKFFLSQITPNDKNLDLIFAFSLERLIQLSFKESSEYTFFNFINDRIYYPSISMESKYVKILNQYGSSQQFINYLYPKNKLMPEVTDYWINTFSKMPSYDTYFAINGVYYNEAKNLINDFDILNDKINLSRSLDNSSNQSLKVSHKINKI